MPEKLEKLGKYTLLEELGSGAFGWVYKASDPLGRIVAVKVLKPGLADDPVTLERFRREAQVAGQLFHNHIATILELDESEGRRFIAMRYVDGVSLDKLIEQKGRLSWQESLTTLSQVAEALDYAHQRGFVHRDVKPSNIMVSPVDGAVLTDFGLVKAAEASGGTSSGVILGTPRFIAPEIWKGQPVGPTADVYSLACVAYEMLTGQVLFDGQNTPEIMTRHVLSGPQFPERWPENLPPGFSQVLARALEKEPGKRYASASEFVAELKRLDNEQIAHLAQAAELAEKRHQAQAMEPNKKRPRDFFGYYWPAFVMTGMMILTGCVILGIVFYFIRGLPSKSNSNKTTVVATEVSTSQQPVFSPEVSLTPEPTYTNEPTLIPTIVPSATSVPGSGVKQTRLADGMVMMYVPAGPFTMGSDIVGEDNGNPAHLVTLNSYWIDQTEVTNVMFEKFINATKYQTDAEKEHQSMIFNPLNGKMEFVNGADWRHPQGPNSSLAGLERHPVVNVSWNDASEYCGWAGTGQPLEVRLPTEAEWEKAARGPNGLSYPWGEQKPDGSLANYADKNLPGVSWADQNVDDGYEFTAPVGSYPKGASPYGALDMAGNVSEWISSPYVENYNASSTPNDSLRMQRGRSWNEIGDFLRSFYRSLGWPPSSALSYVGFRCAHSDASSENPVIHSNLTATATLSPVETISPSETLSPSATITPSASLVLKRPSIPGGPGNAVDLVGDISAGEKIYAQNCVACHGLGGVGGIANPGSEKGTVPALNPIDSTIADPDLKTYATNLDLFIEHGSIPAGQSPTKVMGAWGDSKVLRPSQIADVIAYIIGLNK